MYIGPWQEYALYQAQKSIPVPIQQKSELAAYVAATNQLEERNQLQREFEKALFASLDSESAQKAFEAIKNTLELRQENVSISSNVPSESSRFYKRRRPTDISSNHSNISGPRLPHIHSYTSKIKVKPTISSQLHGIDRKSLGTPKSSVSEPLPRITPLKSNETNRVSVSNHGSSYQSSYDVHSVMSILRRERAMKRQEETLKSQPSSWQWSNTKMSKEDKQKITKLDKMIENRIEKLKKMKELYQEKSSQSVDEEPYVHIETNHKKSTVKLEPIPSHQIQDMNGSIPTSRADTSMSDTITDPIDMTGPMEYEAVLKYFNLSINKSIPILESLDNTENLAARINDAMTSNSDSKSSTKTSSSITLPPIELISNEQMARTIYNDRNDDLSSHYNSTKLEPIKEYNANEIDSESQDGLDNLINWSLNLQYDFPS